MDPITRRELLERSARAALVVAGVGTLGPLAACTPRPRATQDVQRLADSVSGQVVTPGDAAYADAKLLFNPQFDSAQPLAIVYCSTPKDIATAVGFARDHDLLPAARSGGHSFGGYSAPTDGIVVDVSRMSAIKVAPDGGSVTVAPGALNVDLYSTLGPHGLVVPTGTCPTVGVAGLVLGGGFGYSSRTLGLTADNLLQVDLVLASGEQVTCSASQNADLYWACRGGGGGNFGIATSFRFRTHPIGEVSVYALEWDWRDAPGVFGAWQRWAPDAPDALFSTCNLSRSGGPQPTGPTVSSAGQLFGSPDELARLLAPLDDVARPTKRSVKRTTFVEASRLWAGSDCDAGACSPRAANPYKVKSQFFDALIPAAGISAAIEAVERWPGSLASSPMVGLELNSWGGQIAATSSDATAFVHRNERMLAIFGSTWSTHDGDPKIAELHEWQEAFATTMAPFSSGSAYQNLIDPSLQDWENAYYGSNFTRLTQIKAKHDPHDVFRFRQGISPP